jgi:hypothetical protein
MSHLLDRRRFLVSLVGLGSALAACKREGERCRTCGMKIDPSSTWRTELVGADGKVTAFDAPRCALSAMRSGKVPAVSLRAHEYYDAKGPLRDGKELRFLVGGDVIGPMGPDLVPVEPSRASKFIQDHGAERALTLDEVTADVLANLR